MVLMMAKKKKKRSPPSRGRGEVLTSYDPQAEKRKRRAASKPNPAAQSIPPENSGDDFHLDTIGRRLGGAGTAEKDQLVKDKHRETVRKYQDRIGKASRDIYPIPWEHINWERRLACKWDLKLFNETYLPTVFKLDWADYHLVFMEVAQEVYTEIGIKHCFAVPRGGGKTVLARGSMLWGTCYGHKVFPYFIGSKDQASHQTLAFVKQHLYANVKIQQDFPEVSWAIQKIENRFSGARSQLYQGYPTSLIWSTGEIRYPSLLLDDDVAKFYLDHDADCLRWVESFQRHIAVSAGVNINTSGIDGSIRGTVETHPITLEEVRPDIVLLDDVQKDQKAESPTSCEKMILLIDGAIEGMAGPEAKLSALMPCTVIREGDVSDTFLSRDLKPDWQGQRTQMVPQWPKGMTDYDISMDNDTCKLWNEYEEERRKSLKLYGNIGQATEFYRKNREVMDEGFQVSWEGRYVKKGKNEELSAIQGAMNFRFHSPMTFPSEYQNIGRPDAAIGTVMINAEELSKKQSPLDRMCVPVDTQYIATYIDVQDEIFYLATVAVSQDFTGVIPYYGNYPEIYTPVFRRTQTSGWNMLSREFFVAHPEYRAKAIKTKGGKFKAPLSEKIYYGLKNAIRYAKNLKYIREDGQNTEMHADIIGVDARWGETADAVKRCVHDFKDPRVIVYLGHSIPPTNNQLEEYTRAGQFKTWLFEDQRHPNVRHCKWVYRLGKDNQYYMMADVDRLKDFMFGRLTTAEGGRGSISLYKAIPDRHFLFCNHICNSEYPEPVEAKGIKKNKWMMRESRPDNDWLDCITGCMCLLSYIGALLILSVDDKPVTKITRSLSRLRAEKLAKRSR